MDRIINGYAMPRFRNTAQQHERRVGVEIELAGFNFAELLALVNGYFSGSSSESQGLFAATVHTDSGDYKIELDCQNLVDKMVGDAIIPKDMNDLQRWTLQMLEQAAEVVVPLEVVSPPLPMSRLDEVGKLCNYLRQEGARGTHHSPLYAFGLHLNPELPALDVQTILNYMRAFICFYDWFKARQQVDVSRRLTFYISHYPRAYLKKIIAADYQPTLEQLIEDYLEFNPERNRAMDMLPMFRHLLPELVDAYTDDPRIQSRPTLHFRMPDCDIDNPGWDFASVWEDWVQIDDLASQPDLLAQVCRDYESSLQLSLTNLGRDWLKESRQWLKYLSV